MIRRIRIFLIWGLLSRISWGLKMRPEVTHGRCEPVTIPLCLHLDYNQTLYPNLMGNHDQEEAGLEVHPYFPLIKVDCSPDIQMFLCSMYAPACTVLEYPLPPCRDLCLSARSGCEGMMAQFGFPWPAGFECSQFPVFGEDAICVGRTNQAKFSDSDLEFYKTTTTDRYHSLGGAVGPDGGRPPDYDAVVDFVCPSVLRVPKEYEYKLRIGGGDAGYADEGEVGGSGVGGKVQVVDDCGAPCYHLFFNRQESEQMRLWVGIWSVICLASTIFTLSTVTVDAARFPYPEKPIAYLSFCYMSAAALYIVGFAAGDIVACNPAFPTQIHNLEPERLLKQGSLHDWKCSVLGMLLYFFLSAASLWWVALTAAWFISAGLKWGQEAIDAKASYFHAFVWTAASLQTILVLILKKIEGDILSGVCFVGVLDLDGLFYLIILPFTSYLFVGIVLLVLGFSSLLRIRTVMKNDGAKTDKLERLMLRIGTFSALYILPTSVVVGCYIYEYIHLPSWMSLWQEDICRHEVLSIKWQVPCRYPEGRGPDIAPPNFYVFMLKYVMIFIVGIFSGFWVWSGKTVASWKAFYGRLFRGYRQDAGV